jgi:hypothetical protein
VEPRYLTLQEFQNWITREHFYWDFDTPKNVVILLSDDENIMDFLDSDFVDYCHSFPIYTLNNCPRIVNTPALVILGETCLQQEWELYEIISTLTPRLPICLVLEKETQQTRECESHFMRY